MKEIGDRIRDNRLILGLTQGELGKNLGVSDVTVSKWESGLNHPKGSHLLSLANVLNTTTEWLLTGKGTATQSAGTTSNVQSAPLGSALVPVLSYVQAGAWHEPRAVRAQDGDIEYVSANFTNTESLFALYIKGDSMEPEFKEGDLIIVDGDLSPCPGDYVVAKNGGDESTFKKYRPRGHNNNGQEYFELQPLNSDYPAMRSDMTKIKIIGVMVEHRRFRKR